MTTTKPRGLTDRQYEELCNFEDAYWTHWTGGNPLASLTANGYLRTANRIGPGWYQITSEGQRALRIYRERYGVRT